MRTQATETTDSTRERVSIKLLKTSTATKNPREQVSKRVTEVKLGEPIPGYAGVNQRIGADNIFGYTYADARKKAKDSLSRVDKDRADQLRATSGFEPTWKN